MCVVTIGRNWVRLITKKKCGRKRRPKGNTKSTRRRKWRGERERWEEGGATGQFLLLNFCWSWEGYTPIVDLSLSCCRCWRRCDLLTKFIKLWAKMQASHSCFHNVARAAGRLSCRSSKNKVEGKKYEEKKKSS